MDIQHKNTLSIRQPVNIPRPLWEPRPLTSVITTTKPSLKQHRSMKKKRRIKRCHGQRKLRRFKNKWRRRGMSEEEIKKLTDNYNRKKNGISTKEISDNNNDQPEQPTTTTMENLQTTKKKSNKRKRMVTSISSRSMTEQLPKKIKKKNVNINLTTIKPNYRLPKYLTKAPNLLFQNLRLQLKQKLNTKKQQRFIHCRLQLFDQQQRLDIHRNLWQSYLTLGSEHQLWPDHVYKRVKSNEHTLCQQLVQHRLTELHGQYDQCTTELRIQSLLCPSTLLPLDIIDHNLREFVELQQKYFLNKINSRLTRYKNIIQEKELFQTLSNYNLSILQKNTIDQLVQLRETQLQVFEEFLQLETRVSIQFLPEDFDNLEYFITPNLYSPLIQDSMAIELKQQQYKIIQEAKRTWLNIYIDAHEMKYREYEHQYQQDLKQFEFISSVHIDTTDITLFNCVLLYINHRVDRLKQEIYYEKLPIYRRKFVRLRQHLISTKKNLVTVAPTLILDVICHPFTIAELAYLSRSPTYIRPNQSALRPFEQREKQVDKEVNDIMNKLKNYMADFYDRRPGLPKTLLMYKFYSERLRIYLLRRYMTPLPLMDHLRARRELKLVKSIGRKLKKYKLILRETDKSGVLHIGHARDYERKAIEYREKTGAYEELTSNPLDEIFYQVIQLLNKLRSTKKISVSQHVKMMPIRNKIEVAYMYFLPKPHKKGTPLRPIINTIHAATTQISKYLDQLIRPLFDRYARHTTIVDGVDLLNQLHKYIQNGFFNSSTLFVAFDITNLYTMLPQEESLAILAEFLHVHHCEIIQGISIDTIVDLGRIVLQANAFVYGKKFYRQIIGGAMGSAFTLTLANIFMWKWERQAILSKLPAHEFYGRYIDDIFFTCNESETKVKKWLESANQFHPNIKLTYTIAKNVPFLDVLVRNQNGILFSSVYHKPAAEPSLLSFLSDHPRHVFRNVIQTALMRAIRHSSTFDAFNIERRTIRLTLLLNG
ncbi:unnamed protein product [Rotaria sp. Silwood2]|nr:unnamed protein product [Rotaria sp. Silwood2]